MDSWIDIFATIAPLIMLVLLFLFNVGFGYSLGDRGIEIIFFQRLPVRTIPYDKVEGLQRTNRKLYTRFFITQYTSRLMGPSVTIYLKGLRRPVEVTPDYPYEFVSKVSQRVYQQTGEWPWVH